LKGDHPRAFCATDQQLQDLQRNCTGLDASILQIDPTFSLGSFYVTCTSYRSKQFENAKNEKKTLMPGPYMLHGTRSEEDYEFFARHISTGIKHKAVVACGSDGEKAIRSGFRRVESFKESIWLVCMLHAKDNCKRKLEELGVKTETKSRILRDIYGCEKQQEGARIRQGGMVDLESPEEFDQELERACWNDLETTDTGKPPKFKDWFIRYKAVECKSSMLPPMRTAAGLGMPPCQFTTNDVESENMNVKREMDFSKKTWDEAANHLHARVLAHFEELSRGVYKEGRYRLSESFKDLEKEPYEWSAMTVTERRHHLQQANLKPTMKGNCELSISAEESGIQGYSVGDVKSAWGEAADILSSEESIVAHPGNVPKTVVFEGNDVHTVVKDGQQYSCDSTCDRYKYFDHVFCPHTIAVAERNGSLSQFLGWINTRISAKSASLLNASMNASCYGSGQKKGKRKGKNNCLSSDIDVFVPKVTHSAPSTSVPRSAAVLPVGPGSVCAAHRISLPPLTSLQISVQQRQPFTITLVAGLIKRCRGCGREFGQKYKTPPHDVILRKKDYKPVGARFARSYLYATSMFSCFHA